MLKGVKLLFDLRPKERPEELFGRGSELEEVLRLVRLGSWVVSSDLGWWVSPVFSRSLERVSRSRGIGRFT